LFIVGNFYRYYRLNDNDADTDTDYGDGTEPCVGATPANVGGREVFRDTIAIWPTALYQYPKIVHLLSAP